MGLRSINNNLITGGWSEQEAGLEMPKIKFLNTVSIVSLSILVAYTVLNFIEGTYWELIIKAVQIGCLIAALIIVRKKKSLKLAANLLCFVFLTISLATFFTGEPGTGAFWVFLYPPLILFALGSKKGLYWIYFIFVLFAIIGVLAYFDLVYSPYTGLDLFYFLLILFVISMLNGFFQVSHERNQATIRKQASQLKNKNERLKKESEKRRKNLKKIKEQKETAEKMNELIVGREKRIIDLKKQVDSLKKQVK